MIREQQRFRQSSAYHSYLVRFWQNNPQGDWRASAQCVQSGNTILFGTIERLLAFLQSEVTVNQREATVETGALSDEPDALTR